MKYSNLTALAAQYGIYRSQREGSNRLFWKVTCECGNEMMKGWVANMPPDQMVKFFRRAGWELTDKSSPICPTCVEDAKGKRMAEAETVKESQINAKLLRKIYALLDEQFDEAKRLYKAGWSDETVAKETGASVVFVKKVRREAYGELAEDPEITKLRNDAQKLVAKLDQAEKDLLDKLSNSIDPIRKQLQNLLARVEAFERRN